MNSQNLVNDWLDECRTETTRLAYKDRIQVFQSWLGKPVEEFVKLSPREMRHEALKFQKEQLEEGMKVNSIISVLTALASFCSFSDKPLMLRGKRIRTQVDLTSHVFTNGDLTRMFDVALTQEKAILATFCSLGWEVTSVLRLQRSHIQSLLERAKEQDEHFIYFQNQRQKTGELRLGILNPLAIEWLEKWLKEWHGERLFEFETKEGVNVMLRRLAEHGQVKATGRIHSHLIRKWVMSGLSRGGFNEYQIKFVMGKAIPISEATYLQTLELEVRERYPKAYEQYLNIRPSKIVQIVDEDLKMRIAQLTRENEEMKKRLAEAEESKLFLTPEQRETLIKLIQKERDKKG